MAHVTFPEMKRAQLVALTGLSPRHISRIAPNIPGARPTPGGQWTWDENAPGFRQWAKEMKQKHDVRQPNHHTHPTITEQLNLIKNRDERARWKEIAERLNYTPVQLLLARVHDPVERERWAQNVEKWKLTPRELQLSIRNGVVTRISVTQARRGGGGGVSSWLGVSTMWDLLRKQIGEQWKEWSVEELDEIIRKQAPMVEFHRQLVGRRNEVQACQRQASASR